MTSRRSTAARASRRYIITTEAQLIMDGVPRDDNGFLLHMARQRALLSLEARELLRRDASTMGELDRVVAFATLYMTMHHLESDLRRRIIRSPLKPVPDWVRLYTDDTLGKDAYEALVTNNPHVRISSRKHHV